MSPRTVITWAENAEIFRRCRLRLPRHLPQQVRRAGAAAGGGVLSALLQRRADGVRGERGAELIAPSGRRGLGRSHPSLLAQKRSSVSWLRPGHAARPMTRDRCDQAASRRDAEGSADRAVQALGDVVPARHCQATPSSRSRSPPSGRACRPARRAAARAARAR